MDPLVDRVARRFLASPSPKEIPVRNRDTGRIVYVLPETLKDEPGQYRKLPKDEAGDPRWRGKPKPARRPAKPHKPEIPRDPPPAPVKPLDPPKGPKPAKPPKPVPPLKGPKIPEAPKPRKWEKRKPFLAGDEVAERVLERWLASV